MTEVPRLPVLISAAAERRCKILCSLRSVRRFARWRNPRTVPVVSYCQPPKTVDIVCRNGLGERVLRPSTDSNFSIRHSDLSISSAALLCAILARSIAFCESFLACTQLLYNCRHSTIVVPIENQQMPTLVCSHRISPRTASPDARRVQGGTLVKL